MARHPEPAPEAGDRRRRACAGRWLVNLALLAVVAALTAISLLPSPAGESGDRPATHGDQRATGHAPADRARPIGHRA